ncbi:MAG TPA: hypothetical protein VKD72_27485 [Gemmataceae bacterium]|nr:hypothetical protein [Gemmataceae bacterium]
MVVVGGGASSSVASPTKAFAADSSAFVCPVCVQLSFAVSAVDTDEENFSSALPRHSASTSTPFETAFDWHLSFPEAFFPAAWIFFESQPLGPGALLFTMFRTVFTKVSTLLSMAFTSPFGARQSPLDSAFVNPEVSLSCALARQSESTGSPFDTAFA